MALWLHEHLWQERLGQNGQFVSAEIVADRYYCNLMVWWQRQNEFQSCHLLGLALALEPKTLGNLGTIIVLAAATASGLWRAIV